MKKEIYIIITLFTITIQLKALGWQNSSVEFHSLALENNGRLWAGAVDFYGQPGNETNTNQHQFLKIPGLFFPSL